MLDPSSELFPAEDIYPNGTLYQFSGTITENVSTSLDLTVQKKWTLNVPVGVGLDVEIILNANAIMGQVYKPTDNPGYEVQVQADVNDFYYQINENDTIPKLYWGPQPLSSNLTNDQYRPYRLK